ncbi:MAG: hypothetical protein J6W82_09560 [Bacteroidales bacterium]|nr:hypothetical protein [Bacteroidales bacterium]
MADWRELLSTFNTVTPAQKQNEQIKSLKDVDQTSSSSLNSSQPAFDTSEDGVTRYGIILTDTVRISKKYKIESGIVLDALKRFTSIESSYNHFWHLLDLSLYRSLYKQGDWQSQRDLITTFISKAGLTPSPSLSLFIIGGDDVVSIPYFAFKEKKDEQIEDCRIEADILYGLFGVNDPCAFIEDAFKSKNKQRFIQHTQCSVSRLPLETNPTISFEEAVSFYLERVTKVQDRILINKVQLISAQNWMPASTFLQNGMVPVHSKADGNYDYVCNGIYLSPLVDLFKKEDSWHERLTTDLGDADFTMMNLHGAGQDELPFYFGEPDIWDNNMGCSRGPVAYAPQLAHFNKSAFIFSLACYGAKHTGLQNEQSVLLSAITANTLLFIGSSHSTPYDTGCRHYIEILIKLFLKHFQSGLCADEALTKAKIDYLFDYAFHEPQIAWELELRTIAEFNSFGCPMISCDPNSRIDVELIKDDLNAVGSSSTFGFKNVSSDKCEQYKISELDLLYHTVRDEVDDTLMGMFDFFAKKLGDEGLRNVLFSDCRRDNNYYTIIYSFDQYNEGRVWLTFDIITGQLINYTRTR